MDEVNVSNLNRETKKVREEILIKKEEIDSKYLYLFVKRIIDIFGSLIGLVVLSPLFLIVAYKIKKEDPSGPIFFSQERVGKNGKTFKMYKFRSMCVDAEEKLEFLLQHNEVQGAMFKMKEDPRVTKIGKFIRKTSIDELPQLWNVIKGEMSLVGPRPPLIREVLEYTSFSKQRLLVKPGCTGLWQVSGRNHVGFEEMVELDLKYISNQSLVNDFKIILKTFKIIILPNGAY
ncbi:UDP-phosphate galactose phosphotransferase [Enterococcus casseliflavus]|uniref:sugar transferase n=1 Tax=Enterococcus casseliflavus TaxID=37734 RepID=UPI0009C0F7CE|nr:sugar transferase [Enterococcus casseliflavus]OQO83705.1 UDP-phosphate galactose phosphotransferase [Enterococcus casseliflavus]